jgi:hypothetical protein
MGRQLTAEGSNVLSTTPVPRVGPEKKKKSKRAYFDINS